MDDGLLNKSATPLMDDRLLGYRVTYLSECRALDVFDCAQFLGQLLAHFQGQRLLFVLRQLLDGGGVVAQVNLKRRHITLISHRRLKSIRVKKGIEM